MTFKRRAISGLRPIRTLLSPRIVLYAIKVFTDLILFGRRDAESYCGELRPSAAAPFVQIVSLFPISRILLMWLVTANCR
jgi:hypothetical protein